MPKVMKTCRVCGRSYEACRTVNSALGVFRWQEVACSPECGSIYLQKLNESRGIHAAEQEAEPVAASVIEPVVTESAPEPTEESAAESVKHQARKKKARKDEGVTPLRLEAEGDNANAADE